MPVSSADVPAVKSSVPAEIFRACAVATSDAPFGMILPLKVLSPAKVCAPVVISPAADALAGVDGIVIFLLFIPVICPEASDTGCDTLNEPPNAGV